MFAPFAAAQTTVYWDGDGSGTVGGGTGNWNASLTRWTTNPSGSSYSGWTAGNYAVFQNTAGTVTITGNVTAGKITFGTTGYTIARSASNTLTLNGIATIDTGTFNATMSTVIAGSAGVTKIGSGTLTLSGTNTVTGGYTIGSLGGATGGTLAVTTGNAITTGADLTIYGGTLSMGSANRTIGKISLGGGNNTTSANITGTGTLTLGGNVTFSDGNNAQGATIGTKLALGGNRTFNIGDSTNAATDLTVTGVISNGSGNRSLTKTGSGTLVLSGNNTYSGGTILSAGSLGAGHNSAFGTGSLALNGGSLFASGSNRTLSNSVTVGGNFAIGGSNNLTFTGAFNLGSGNRTITVNNSGLTTISGVVSNGGYATLTKAGSGTLVLSGANTFNGPVSVAAGALRLQNNSALGASGTYNNSVAAGAELQFQGGITVNPGSFSINGSGISGAGALHNISGSNTLGGQVNLAGATTIGADAGGSLTLSGTVSLAHKLTTAGAGNLVFSGTLGGAGAWDVNGNGTVTLSGSGANNNSGLTTVNGGTLVLAKNAGTQALGGDLVIGGGTVRLDNSNQLADHKSVTINSASGVLNLNNKSDAIAGLTMTGGSVTTGTGTLILSSSGGGVTTNASNSSATISGKLSLAAYSSTFNVADGAAATDLSISATIIDSGALAKAGAGTLVLSGSNTYTGGTTLSDGSLGAGHNNAFGTGTLTLNGGSLFASGSNRTLSNSVTVGGNFAVGGTNNLTLSGAVALGSGNRTITIDNSGLTTLSGVVSGPAGLTKAGTGTLVLSGNNTYSGGTTLADGSLGAGHNNAFGTGTLTLNGGSLFASGSNRTLSNSVTVGGNFAVGGTNNLTLSGAVALGSGNRTITIDNSGLTTFSGVVSGSANFTKAGTGNLTLSGANTFSGNVTVGAGTLVASGTTSAIGGFAALGSRILGSETTVVTVADGASLGLVGRNSWDYATAANATQQYMTMSLSGSGVNGSGALNNISGNSAWMGNINLAADATIRNSATSSVSDTLFIGPYIQYAPTFLRLNGNTLTITGTGNVSIMNQVGSSGGDTGGVVINSSGTVQFGGDRNHYTGATDVKSGTLELFTASVTPQPNTAILGALTIGDGDTVNNGSATVRVFYNEQISDNAAVTINADGLLELGAAYTPAETLGSVTMRGGTIETYGGTLFVNGSLTVSNHVLTNASVTATISGGVGGVGGIAFNNNNSIDVTGSNSLLVNALISSGTQAGFTKNGTGTMILTADNYNAGNGYAGVTTINNGILNIRHGGALGSRLSGMDNGTLVNSGGTLQLQSGISVASEALTLNGNGYSSLGALNNLSGSNTWSGAITLGSGATIGQDVTVSSTAGTMTLSGTITGSKSSGTQTFTVGGGGNTSISGPISDGSNGGALALQKTGSGTLSLSGNNTFTGAVNVTAGTVNVTANNVLQGSGGVRNTVNVSSGATFAVSGGGGNTNTIRGLTGTGLVSIAANTNLVVSNSASNTFGGRLTGSGLFEKTGAGTFTFASTSNTSAFNFSGTVKLSAGITEFQGGGAGNALSIGTLQLAGGTVYLNAAYINVGTLNITASTILDFGTGAASILNANNIYIASGVTLTVKNWSSEMDFLFANLGFRRNNGSGTLAVYNAIGTFPQNQVHFEGTISADGSHTTWTNYDYDGYVNKQIRPIPEPSTYGLAFIAGCIAWVGWRRFRGSRKDT